LAVLAADVRRSAMARLSAACRATRRQSGFARTSDAAHADYQLISTQTVRGKRRIC